MTQLPQHSWDTHVHIFGDLNHYPRSNPKSIYPVPADCDLRALLSLHREMGISNAVLIQPTVYGTDHSLLFDVLSESSGGLKGVAILDDTVPDAELARLDAVGVCCARLNFGQRFHLKPDAATLRRTIARVAEIGWSLKVFGFGDDLLEFEQELRAIEIPAMIDHLGGVDYSLGTNQPPLQFMIDLLKRPNWWVSLSNGDIRSRSATLGEDSVAIGKALFNAAPDRCVWGSDWPHVHRFIRPGVERFLGADPQAELARVDLLRGYLPDADALEAVMSRNPPRFFAR